MLEFLAQTGRTEHGGDFLRALVEHIGRITNVDYVIVDRLTVDPQIAATVAIFAQVGVMPNRKYNLKGAPCENVIGKELCCYSHGVQRLFPDDALLVEMQAESYIGMPLWDSNGQPLGSIALIDRRPMLSSEPYAALLRLAATHAAAELERGRAMAELARKNRALRMLSSSNRALSRISEEVALSQEICRIAVDEGGHHLALVLFAEPDHPKAWREVAHAGADPAFARSATETWWHEALAGQGPGWIAARTGQPTVVRDILNEPAAAWREEALRSGYRCVVILPLKSEELTFAALVIGSIAVDVFDAEEVAILNELAGNLSFGVMAFRERKRVEAQSDARGMAIANEAKNAFVAQLSHELRTPLNAILGFTQILQRDQSLNERHTRALKIIQESGQDLLTLINNIVDLARSDAAKLELFPHQVDLPVFLRLVGDTIRVKADEKNLLFAYHGDSDLPGTVCADEKRLRQILLNLLSNAVKFTDGGQITLRVMRLAMPAAGAVARLRFEIEGQGDGMSQARLFQPEQVAEAKRGKGGTGLGLTVTRRLILLMGGDIEVHSRLGEGSVFAFEIELPVSEAPVRQVSIREQAAPVPQEATNDEGTLIAPPAEEMSVLRELARSGDMRSILGRADYVRTLDPRYAAFAARLRALAERYQSSAITTMIERYSNPLGPTDT
jgi:signal transduction histidine kinase